jgi:hypothetical protein
MGESFGAIVAAAGISPPRTFRYTINRMNKIYFSYKI